MVLVERAPILLIRGCLRLWSYVHLWMLRNTLISPLPWPTRLNFPSFAPYPPIRSGTHCLPYPPTNFPPTNFPLHALFKCLLTPVDAWTACVPNTWVQEVESPGFCTQFFLPPPRVLQPSCVTAQTSRLQLGPLGSSCLICFCPSSYDKIFPGV